MVHRELFIVNEANKYRSSWQFKLLETEKIIPTAKFAPDENWEWYTKFLIGIYLLGERLRYGNRLNFSIFNTFTRLIIFSSFFLICAAKYFNMGGWGNRVKGRWEHFLLKGEK